MAKKEKKPMFWICGNYYDSRKKWQQIKSKIGDANIESLDCGSNSADTPSGCRAAQAADVILLLKSKDMFDERPRIIRMRGLPPDYTLIADYLKYVNDNNILVVDGPIGYQERRFISAASSSFYKTISTEGIVFDVGTDAKNDSDAADWVSSVVDDHDKEIKSDACQLLVSMKGRNYDTLYVEINKLLAYQSKKVITLEDVQSCSVPIHTKTAWDLVDSLDLCKLDESLTHLQSFYQFAGFQTGKSFRGDIEMLLGALHYHFLFLLFAKDACGESFNYDAVCKKIEGYKKENDDGKREFDFFGKQAVMMASRNETFKKALRARKQQIYGAYLAVCRCMRKIRFVYSEEFAKTCLDAMCMHICGSITEVQMLGLLGYSQSEIKHKIGV